MPKHARDKNHRAHNVFTGMTDCYVRGCLHDNGPTFVPERIHSGSRPSCSSEFVSLIPPDNVIPERVKPVRVH